MDKFVENYAKVNKDVREEIARNMVNVIGLEHLLYGVTHALLCECIDNKVPRDERRKAILDKVNLELDKWIE